MTRASTIFAVCTGGAALFFALTAPLTRHMRTHDHPVLAAVSVAHTAESRVAPSRTPVHVGVVRDRPASTARSEEAAAGRVLQVCPYEPDEKVYIVHLAEQDAPPLRADGSRAEAERVQALHVPPGVYDVETYTLRFGSTTASMRLERWYMRMYAADGTLLAYSSTTRDLADEEQAAQEALGAPLVLTATTTSVRARHAGYSSGEPAFVVPVCARLTPHASGTASSFVRAEEGHSMPQEAQPALAVRAAVSEVTDMPPLYSMGTALTFVLSLIALSAFLAPVNARATPLAERTSDD